MREFLQQGDFGRASELLGRPFSIKGRVVYGQQLGRELGFPTANVNLNRYSAPLSGVYAVRVDTGGVEYIGAANVGVRPTVGDLVSPYSRCICWIFKAIYMVRESMYGLKKKFGMSKNLLT